MSKMLKLWQHLQVFLLVLGFGLIPTSVYAQDAADEGVHVYVEETEVVTSAAATPVVPATKRGTETRIVDGKAQRGELWCVVLPESRTKHSSIGTFPAASESMTVLWDSESQIRTEFKLENLDAQSQTASIYARAWVDFTPFGLPKTTAMFEDSKTIQLGFGAVVTDTLKSVEVKSGRITTQVGQPLTVTIAADSRSEIRTTANIAWRIETFTKDSICLFYAGEPVQIGDYVWEDSNHDGVQQDNEHGVQGVKVSWTGPENGSTTTDSGGKYQTPLMAAGTFTITFSVPVGYTSTLELKGSSLLDSNPIVSTVTLLPGTVDLTIDHGLVGNGVLGDRCWRDSNNNGRQDTGEPGVQGCVITVYTCDDTARQVSTVTSDNNGLWKVVNLPPGSYLARAELPESGFVFTAPNIGDNEGDSNADPNSGAMECVTLSPETGMTDLTLDIGVLQHHDIGISRKTMMPENVGTGDIVTSTVTVINSGPGPAFEAYLVDSPQDGLEFVSIPQNCEVTVVNELLCDLGDMAPRQQITLVYTMRVTRSLTGILRNAVMTHARGIDLDLANNDYDAYVFVINGKVYFVYVPIVNNKPDEPTHQNPCEYLISSDLHMLSKGKETVFALQDFWGLTMTPPGGQDLDFLAPTEFWLTYPEGTDINGIHFVWIQYKPFYRVVMGLAEDEFTFDGGYPGESFRMVGRQTSWLDSETNQCNTGFTLEADIDPPLEVVVAWVQTVLNILGEIVNEETINTNQ